MILDVRCWILDARRWILDSRQQMHSFLYEHPASSIEYLSCLTLDPSTP